MIKRNTSKPGKKIVVSKYDTLLQGDINLNKQTLNNPYCVATIGATYISSDFYYSCIDLNVSINVNFR
jgi:hypothetical protein